MSLSVPRPTARCRPSNGDLAGGRHRARDLDRRERPGRAAAAAAGGGTTSDCSAGGADGSSAGRDDGRERSVGDGRGGSIGAATRARPRRARPQPPAAPAVACPAAASTWIRRGAPVGSGPGQAGAPAPCVGRGTRGGSSATTPVPGDGRLGRPRTLQPDRSEARRRRAHEARVERLGIHLQVTLRDPGGRDEQHLRARHEPVALLIARAARMASARSPGELVARLAWSAARSAGWSTMRYRLGTYV